MESETNFYRTISLLFIEDDDVILELLSSMLTLKFPDVMLYTANNGRLGLELFKAHEPEIVITDINMSLMCGIQMSENIRAIKPETMIIAITGNSPESGNNGKFILSSLGVNPVEFDHIFVKPVNLSELFCVIEQFIGEIDQRIRQGLPT